MRSQKAIFFYLVLFVISSCAPKPYAKTNKAHKKQVKQLAAVIMETPLKDSFATAVWVGTTNFNLRKPNFVIIHHTAQKSCDQTLKTFTLTRTQVSSHYVICKDGTVHHMLNDLLRGHHAGVSKWGNATDLNSSATNGVGCQRNGESTRSMAAMSAPASPAPLPAKSRRG